MHRTLSLIVFIFFVLLFSGCNTLYNSRIINIEIAVPGRVRMSPEFRTAAIKYNNCNVAPNEFFSNYFKNEKTFPDTTNLDSVASKIYFNAFMQTLNNQFFFDSIAELKPADFSDISVIGLPENPENYANDTLKYENFESRKYAISALSQLITGFPTNHPENEKRKYIDPDYGLYSKKEIREIADSTESDLLFSLDYFAAIDGILTEFQYQYLETVYIISFWNVYDLQKKELHFFYDKVDTISWEAHKYAYDELKRKLPRREDAVLIAAEIAGSGFADFLVPHWVEVQRMYYKSGNVELTKTNELVEKGKWLKAAEIWKDNVVNKNKRIAAKSMFNLALACEMEGNLDAAIDWTVKSFHVFENKNEIHHQNCLEYINILGQRKLDIKNINSQMNAEISNFPENKNE